MVCQLQRGRHGNGQDLCQVAAVWLSWPSGVTSRAIFLTAAKVPLTKPELISVFRGILEVIEIPAANYAGHSFSIGAATSAALAGVEDSEIQQLDQWQNAAFLHYIRY